MTANTEIEKQENDEEEEDVIKPKLKKRKNAFNKLGYSSCLLLNMIHVN